MLTLMTLCMGTILTMWKSPRKILWKMSTSQSMIILLMASLLKPSKSKMTKNLSMNMGMDTLSYPLLMLSCWLIPVSKTAKKKKLKKKKKKDIRIFLTLMKLMLITLMMTFSTTKLLVFFLGFESTLVPTLILITRWGMQKERMEAGYYFVFYTLLSSLPLFISLMFIYNMKKKLKIITTKWKTKWKMGKILAIFCMLAFLVKIPMFGFHLWLPKAHVEAPVAGSMMLAAILLKMGGYGLIRLSKILWMKIKMKISNILMMFCCWGGILTSLICLTQTDLKALMAYSSVSHMSFMVAGILTKTKWAIKGSMMVMVAHGLVSSALFFMAKMFYERSGTRTLIVSRGLKKMFSILPIWWLVFACAKLGLPPLPKAIGEMMMFSSIMKWKLMTYFPIFTTMVFTSMFSLSMFQYLNSGNSFNWSTINIPMKERESLTLTLHLLPLIFLIMKPNIMMIWLT